MMIILKKIKKKLSFLFFKLFLYPKSYYEENDENNYWGKRKSSYLNIKPNIFQLERTTLLKKFLNYSSNSTLFDIGSGDGAQLISIQKTFPLIKIIASDNNEFSINILKKLEFEHYKLNSEDEIFQLLEKIKPKYITIFEVLEHMKSPEKFLLKIISSSQNQVFFSVPNTGFILHRLRFLLGRFPIQWIASPNEHLRFWTLKDMKWWLNYLELDDISKVISYRGLPILNKIFPNLFSEGIFIIINKKKIHK